MKKLLLSLVALAASVAVNAADWYFVYGGNDWKVDESTQLKPTDKPDVYELKNYPVVTDTEKGGVNYQITNADWSVMYGWCAEADGNDVAGNTYKLGHVGNAWINCEDGTYDITFNAADETILFTLVEAGGLDPVDPAADKWYFVYDGNSWTVDETTELKPDGEGLFKLSNYSIAVPEGTDGINFQITNSTWSKTYGWAENDDDTVGATIPLGATGNAWVTCATGSYDIVFDHTNSTVKFTGYDSTGVNNVEAAADAAPEYYTLTGVKVAAPAAAGIYIVRRGNKTSKVIVK